MDSYMKDLKKRIEQRQKELKNLSDEEIMCMHESIYEDLEKEPDGVLMVAITREVDRRFQATSWIWRRRSKPEECQKWIDHKRKTEAMATQYAIGLLSKSNAPQSQETVKRLKELLK